MTQQSHWFGTASLYRCFLVGCLGVCCLLPSTALADDRKPPPPNPAEPVNYIEWINKTYGAGIRDNAWNTYRLAYQELKPFEGNWGDTLKGPWSDNPEVQAWLKANEKALLLFRAATRKDECFMPLHTRESHLVRKDREPPPEPRVKNCLTTVLLPHLGSHRLAVRGLIAQGHGEWQMGYTGRLPDNLLVSLKATRHLDYGATAIQRLVGTACERLAYRALRNALELSDDADALAVRVLPKLAVAAPPRVPLEQTCFFERLLARDLCQRSFQPGEHPGTWEVHEGFVKSFVETMGSVLADLQANSAGELDRFTVDSFCAVLGAHGYKATLREVGVQFDALDAWLKTPYHIAADKRDALKRKVNESFSPWVRIFPRTLIRMRELDQRGRAERRATHLIVHLFVRHSKTGHFPDSLEGLQAPDLNDLRIDPFSGRDLVYKRQGDSFTLYSVASNLKDDGGKHGKKWEEGDFVFWPVQD